jgi:hypothetical protein
LVRDDDEKRLLYDTSNLTARTMRTDDELTVAVVSGEGLVLRVKPKQEEPDSSL